MGRVAPERSRTLDHLEEQHAHSPDIYLLSVRLILDHFRCHVLVCAAERLPVTDERGEPEVAYLCIIVLGEQDVLGLHQQSFYLDIAVHYTVGVHSFNRIAHIAEDFVLGTLG